MNRIIFLAVVLLMIFPAAQSVAAKEETSLNDIVRALEEPFRSKSAGSSPITDFQADFFQESRVASLDRTQQGRGRVTVKFDRIRADRPPRILFRWEYEQPVVQEVVSNGRRLWVYLPENRQVIQSDIDTSGEPRPDDPLAFLTGLGNLARDFVITEASPNQDQQGNFILELRPRTPSAMLQKLKVTVARDAVQESASRGRSGNIFPIVATTVYDPSENSTRIEFSGVRVNRRISDSFFDFVPPAGVEVVSPTGQGVGF